MVHGVLCRLGDLGPWLGRLSSSTVTPTTRCIGCVVKGVARDMIMPLSFSMAPAGQIPMHGMCDLQQWTQVPTAQISSSLWSGARMQ